jgi:hypothetical protein
MRDWLAESRYHSGSDVSHPQLILVLGKNGSDRIADQPNPAALKLGRQVPGRRLPGRGLASNALMDTLETGPEIGVPKTSNQAHSEALVRAKNRRVVQNQSRI